MSCELASMLFLMFLSLMGDERDMIYMVAFVTKIWCTSFSVIFYLEFYIYFYDA